MNAHCHCYECKQDEIISYLGTYPITYPMTNMILCPKCRNKRCPHATDHTNECTNSNEPNQPGSRYQNEQY